MDEKMFYNLEICFNIPYYVVKNNKAFSDMKGLVDLANKLKVEVLDEYANSK
jgi:hypothetical protein